MILVLDIAPSLDFWRKVYPIDRVPENPVCLPIADVAYAQRDVERLRPPWATGEILSNAENILHALTDDRRNRRITSTHAVHLCEGLTDLPESFYALSDSVYVASPEFVFLLAAKLLNQYELIALGDELCGRYGFDESARRGLRTRKAPLTSKQKLQSYLGKSGDTPGCIKAERALAYVVEGSASPMETFDAMALCLPYRLGGYGIPEPIMNREIVLDSRARKIAKQGKCYLDMGWVDPVRNLKIDVEHQGMFDHSSPEDVIADRARVNALVEMGFEVIELTGTIAGDLDAFDLIAQRLAKLLGKRVRKGYLGTTPSRLALREALLHWNSSYGRVR